MALVVAGCGPSTTAPYNPTPAPAPTETIFIANAASGAVTEYNVETGYPQTATLIATFPSEYGGLTLDLFGNLFIAYGNSGLNTVAEYAAPYSSGALRDITSDLSIPTNATVYTGYTGATYDNLFVSNTGNDTVTEYVPPYTGPPVATISSELYAPVGVAANSDDLFVANGGSDSVLEYALPYTSGAPPVATISVDNPQGLAANSRELFIANGGNNTVEEYALPYTSGALPKATISYDVDGPEGIALDEWGFLFVADSGSGVVTDYAAPYTGSRSGLVLTIPTGGTPQYVATNANSLP